MAGDISPMSPVSPTPMVREKRHYPREQRDKNLHRQEQGEQTDDDSQSKKEADDDLQQKSVNSDGKNVKVGHIDEYA